MIQATIKTNLETNTTRDSHRPNIEAMLGAYLAVFSLAEALTIGAKV